MRSIRKCFARPAAATRQKKHTQPDAENVPQEFARLLMHLDPKRFSDPKKLCL